MKGATFKVVHMHIVQPHFNPRTHEGCDIDALPFIL